MLSLVRLLFFANTVAEKLRRDNRLEAEDEADMEEIEDEHGNVSPSC